MTWVGGGDVTSGGKTIRFDLVDPDLVFGYADNNDNSVFDAGDVRVFGLEVQDNGVNPPTFNFALFDNLDHHTVAGADDVEGIKAINLNGVLIATDPGVDPLLLNGSVTVIDDIPVINQGTAQAPSITIDELLGVDATDPNTPPQGDDLNNGFILNTKTASIAGLFGSVSFGADGAGPNGGQSLTLVLKDSAGNVITDGTMVLTNLFVTDPNNLYANDQISLVKNPANEFEIFGVITSNPDIEVFRIQTMGLGQVQVDQFLPVAHSVDGSTPADHDDIASLAVPGGQGLGGVYVKLTATDGDGDEVSATSSTKIGVSFEDDGPKINPGTAPLPTITIDELLGVDPTDPNTPPQTDDAGGPFIINTKTVSTTGVFGAVDFGVDGAGGASISHSLVLKDSAGNVVPVGPTLVATNLSVVDLPNSFANDTVSLTKPAANIILGVVTGNPAVVVFRIEILANGNIKVDQFRSIAHDTDGTTPAQHDDLAILSVLSDGQLGGIFAALNAVDGDGDTAQALSSSLNLSFEDDGINVDIAGDTTVDEGATANGTYALQVGIDGLLSGSLSITVGANPAIVVQASALSNGEVVVTPAGTFTFSAPDVNTGNGTWQFAANEISSGGDVTITVNFTATDGDGDSDSDSHQLVIDDKNIPITQSAAFTGLVEEEHLVTGNEDDDDVAGLDTDLNPANNNVTHQVINGSLNVAGGDGDPDVAFSSAVENQIVKFADGALEDVTARNSNSLVRFDYIDADSLEGYVDLNSDGDRDLGEGTIFTMELSNNGAAAPTFTFTLVDQINHHPDGSADDAEGTRVLNLNGVVIASDPGVSDLPLNGNVTVIDDTPRLSVEINNRAAPLFALDETTDPDSDNVVDEGLDTYGSGDPAPVAPEPNGDRDDQTSEVADPTGATPFGVVKTLPGGAGSLFLVNGAVPGADGTGDFTASIGLKLIGVGGSEIAVGTGLQTTLKATQPAPGGNPDSDTTDFIPSTPYADNTIYLFLEPGGLSITGRVGNNPAGPIAFSVELTGSDPSTAVLQVEQFLAIQHPTTPATYDENLVLGVFSDTSGGTAAGVALNYTATFVDGDGDEFSDSNTLFITSTVSFDDDGPKIGASSAEFGPAALIDEFRGADLSDPNKQPQLDDGPPASLVINHVTISVAGQFGTVDFGQDGQGSSLLYELVLKDGTGNIITDPNTLIATNLSVVDVAGSYSNDTISLFYANPDEIFGVVTSNPGVAAFRIHRVVGDQYEIEQYLPISHSVDGSTAADHDDLASMLVGGQGLGGVFWKLTVTDRDLDKASVISSNALNLSFEDDGINVDIASPDAGVIEGATINGTYAIQPGVDGLASGQLQIIANAALVATVSAAGLADGEVINTAIGQFTFSALDANGNGTWSLASADVSGGDVTVSLQLGATDGDGDTDFDAHIFVIDDVDIPFSQVENFTGTVEEEHLNSAKAVGLDDGIGQPAADADTANLNLTTDVTGVDLATLITGGNPPISYGYNVVDGSAVEFVGGADVTSQGQNVEYFKDLNGTTLWGYVDNNSNNFIDGGDRTVFRIDLSGSDMTFTLLDNIDNHTVAAADNVEDIDAIDLSGKLRATDVDGDPFDYQNIHVNVIDDIPDAVSDTASVTAATAAKSNVVLIVDRSGSMDTEVSDDVTRLDVLKDAVEAMFNSGNINAVFIVSFSGTATFHDSGVTGGWYTNLTDALAVIDGLNADGQTDYDAALASVMDPGNWTAPPAGGSQTISMFLSDGEPNETNGTGSIGIDEDDTDVGGIGEETAWINFLTTNNIAKSFAFGFGGLDANDVAFLEPIAWQPGENAAQHDADDVNDADDDTNVIIVDDINDLSQVLITAIGGDADGNVLTDGAIDDAFGADGGRILSVEIDTPGAGTKVYTWNGGSLIDPGTPGNAADDFAGNSLSIATEKGGTFTFNFTSGVWTYTTAANVTTSYNEIVTYTLIDGDGDKDLANLTISVTETIAPTLIVNIVDASLSDTDNSSLVTFEFSEDVSGFDVGDVSFGNGTLSGFTMVDGDSYTAIFTATDGFAGNGSVSVAAGSYTDTSGNLGGAGSDNVVIDTANPTVIVNIVDSAMNDGNLTSNVTFTFSENVIGFGAAGDVTLAGGTLSAITGSGANYSATFTATNPFSGTGSVAVNAASYTDAAGNSGATGSDTVPVDTANPTATINIAATSLNDATNSSLVTITFSEAVTGLTAGDFTLAGNNGALTGLTSGDGGITWTATFNALDGFAGTGSVTLNGTYTDIAGNTGATGASDTVPIDRTNPTVIVNIVDTALNDGDPSSVVNFNFSESVTDFDLTDVSFAGGTLSGFSGSGSSYSATFTATDGVNTTGSVTVNAGGYTDAAGNTGGTGNDTVAITRGPVGGADSIFVNGPSGQQVTVQNAWLLQNDTGVTSIELVLAGSNTSSFTLGASTITFDYDGNSNSTGAFTYVATDGVSDTAPTTVSVTRGNNNAITGDGNNNILIETRGDDNVTMNGGGGSDWIVGGSGADIIVGQEIDFLLRGNGDNDILQVGANFNDTGDAQLDTIETVTLTASGLTLNLGDQTEAFTINGTSGNDIIIAGAGVQTINAGDGADTITGGNGADVINAGGDDNDLDRRPVQCERRIR